MRIFSVNPFLVGRHLGNGPDVTRIDVKLTVDVVEYVHSTSRAA